jgi:8-oxo-dGTP diphosphatase
LTVPLIFVVAGLLIDSNHNCLITQRPADKKMAGFWEFPGGKLDVGEHAEEALIRELHEELGIDVLIQNIKPLTFTTHHYPDFYLFMPLFQINHWHGVPHSKENQQLAWVKIPDLKNYNLLPADIPLVRFLEKYGFKL